MDRDERTKKRRVKKNFGALTALKKWRFASSGRQKMDRDERTKKRRVKKNFGAKKMEVCLKWTATMPSEIFRANQTDSFHWFLC